MRVKTKAVLSAAVLLTSAQAAGNDVTRGQTKSVHCVACHGPSGISPNPTFPNLAGQNATYLAIQLENFRSGERYHPLMTPVAESLTDEDVEDLAAYFSSIAPTLGAHR